MPSIQDDAPSLPGVTATDADDPITPGEVAGEVRDFARAHERQRRQFPRAALLGLIVGLIAVAFRACLDEADAKRNALIGWAHRFPAWGWIVPVVFSAVGAGAGVFLVQRFAPEASGSGIPHLKLVLHRLRGMKWRRILPVKFVGAFLSIGAGLVMGREGPTVQMGGAAGQMISRWFKSTPPRTANSHRRRCGRGLVSGLQRAAFPA